MVLADFHFHELHHKLSSTFSLLFSTLLHFPNRVFISAGLLSFNKIRRTNKRINKIIVKEVKFYCNQLLLNCVVVLHFQSSDNQKRKATLLCSDFEGSKGWNSRSVKVNNSSRQYLSTDSRILGLDSLLAFPAHWYINFLMILFIRTKRLFRLRSFAVQFSKKLSKSIFLWVMRQKLFVFSEHSPVFNCF